MSQKIIIDLAGISILLFSLSCTYPNMDNHSQSAHIFHGKASYYGEGFHGKKTASGETFNMYALTAAHRSFPFGTICKVTNQSNGKSVVVRINDRGPFVQGRILDLSYKAADVIGGLRQGIMNVRIEVIRWGRQ
jgi:rare lipoprotein A